MSTLPLTLPMNLITPVDLPAIPSGGVPRPQLPTSGNPPTIYLIRHGEKYYPAKDNVKAKGNKKGSNTGATTKIFVNDDDPIGLDPDGEIRANTLPSVFNQGNTNPYDIRLVMTMQPQPGGDEERPFETIWPLFLSLQQTVNYYCAFDSGVLRDSTDVAAQHLRDFIASGSPGNVLVCWEHKNLHHVLKDFGIKPAPDYPDLFDVVWELHPSQSGSGWTYDTIRWSTEGTANDMKLASDATAWTNAAGAPSGLVASVSSDTFSWKPNTPSSD